MSTPSGSALATEAAALATEWRHLNTWPNFDAAKAQELAAKMADCLQKFADNEKTQESVNLMANVNADATDRDLIERAAKVYGLNLFWRGWNEFDLPEENVGGFIAYRKSSDGLFRWNPIADIAVRYQMAQDFKLTIDFADEKVYRRLLDGRLIQVRWGAEGEDDEAHAIVRAAAEVGEALAAPVENH